ncbi:MAG: hypothetical protein A2Z91_05345 [Deltaproteobacteria bacterium GWA2_38_16]|nr:MAG: hypothetical protein A2Z91_05345 [Deltaproteobacteria bacterium GWA2_38_16]OGQ03203.1 MAG: hypothetical protein A3D19_04075 [Deltaproteobacteria bacterium RIFCSPHIGHO2_02_FULL_38_15]OGQ34662.1 MAG: hypothetical protein A3A72_00815 [Deltaproteobacteria bacterium RIFCSPLOWO2_01_FULL_38_9]OGQ59796.1 MAG: hypothetical protein A3G92_02790 [Deltaproteobacteria bacterium RIFCSPLOWO2_12_FULL_38_8]HBQ20371.1 hypothetical protein [Deltaproteobacteria bacterium]
MTKLNNHLRELKLLILSMVIFILSIFATTYADIPIGNNRVKEQLDDFFQPSIMKAQLYLQNTVDAGRQGMVSRKNIESGTVAVFRYGNQKASGGFFPATAWATREIERVIREHWEDGGIDPDIADEDLTPEEKAQKDQLTLDARKVVGYTVGEQKRFLTKAWAEKQKELGRELSEDEKEKIKSVIVKNFPLKTDTQTDETEGIAIVNNTSIYKVHEIFSQKGKYSSYLPEFFLFSHALTPEELSARKLKLNPFESFLFARFYIANMTVDYTDFNESKQSFRDVILNTPEGKTKVVIPVITEAWTIDPRFTDDGKFVPVLDEKTGKIIGHNGKFGHNNILVMDGYLETEPYIAKDEKGFEFVDESRVLAIYHTYTRIDPYYRDLTGLTDMFREAEGRRFMEKMVSVIQKY